MSDAKPDKDGKVTLYASGGILAISTGTNVIEFTGGKASVDSELVDVVLRAGKGRVTLKPPTVAAPAPASTPKE